MSRTLTSRLIAYRLSEDQQQLLPKLLRAALQTQTDPYATYPEIGGAAALATAAGNIHAGRTTATGKWENAHAIRAALTAMFQAGDHSPTLLVALELRRGVPRLVLPCSHCRHVLHQHARGADVGLIGYDFEQFIRYGLTELLPCPSGEAGFETDLTPFLPAPDEEADE